MRLCATLLEEAYTCRAQPNVKDLQDMLANLPQFQTQREQYSLHLDMAQECMALFERKKMNLAAHVEQVTKMASNSYRN